MKQIRALAQNGLNFRSVISKSACKRNKNAAVFFCKPGTDEFLKKIKVNWLTVFVSMS